MRGKWIFGTPVISGSYVDGEYVRNIVKITVERKSDPLSSDTYDVIPETLGHYIGRFNGVGSQLYVGSVCKVDGKEYTLVRKGHRFVLEGCPVDVFLNGEENYAIKGVGIVGLVWNTDETRKLYMRC